MQQQVQPGSRTTDVISRPIQVGGMDRWWKRHAIRGLYLQKVYSMGLGEVIKNVS